MGKFTVDEINLMCVFGTENRSKLIADIKNVLPHLEDSDMMEIAENVYKKLERMSDEEFAELVLEPAEGE